jgi:murein DD-endopeptidase MepM/ murein hydrolase activator NlpD
MIKMIGLVMILLLTVCNDKKNIVNSVSDAEYVLPYPVGKSYHVSQSNNSPSGWSHSRSMWNGVFVYAYDFDMPIGTIVTAARSGTVVNVVESFEDGNRIPGRENVVVIRHSDGSFARYFHLTQNGALVEVGQEVARGDTMALSGDTGNSYHPHLHFDVTTGCALPAISCQSIFVNFKNSSAHPNALERGKTYAALPYSNK